MGHLELALRFAAALGLGVLLGLERESRHGGEQTFAGVRTFALISLLGAIAGFLDVRGVVPWLPVALFAAVATLVVVQYSQTAARGDVGMTTEVGALIAFLLGLLCLEGHVAVAAALAVASGLMLALKDWLHRLAGRISAADVEATLKFAIVSLIVLPLVPDRTFGPPPFDVLNPYKIWLMVVLISGVNFAGYLLVKLVGREHGLGLAGLLGGLVSSTAVTLSFAARSRRQPTQSIHLAVGILLAWTVMFFRAIVLPGVVDPGLGLRLLLALGAVGLVNLAVCLVLWRKSRADELASAEAGENPFELGQAVKFGLLYGVVTLGARAAQLWLGGPGLYLAGALAGLTDVDAISLSMANLVREDPASLVVAARTVAIAALANTAVKGVLAGVTGSAELRRRVVPATLLLLAVGSAAALLLL